MSCVQENILHEKLSYLPRATAVGSKLSSLETPEMESFFCIDSLRENTYSVEYLRLAAFKWHSLLDTRCKLAFNSCPLSRG